MLKKLFRVSSIGEGCPREFINNEQPTDVDGYINDLFN